MIIRISEWKRRRRDLLYLMQALIDGRDQQNHELLALEA